MTGRITADPFVETVKNGEAKALFAEVQLSHNGDVRTVQLFPVTGNESWPCKGDVVVVERAGGLLYAVAVWDKTKPSLKPGEKRVYSRNADGSKAADIFLDGDGNIEMNGEDKRFVTYAELNQELQRIWAAVKAHTHVVPGVMSGPAATNASPSADLAPVTLDISASETKTIKTGG